MIERIYRTDLREVEGYPGFYYSSQADDICLNKNGDVLYFKAGRINSNLKLGLNGYAQAGWHDVHRLMAETFLVYPIDCNERVIINHINGIKNDNRLDNIEWITYSGNLQHAYATGLRTDNVTVLVKNLETGEVMEYYSIGSCAKALGTSPSQIWHWLRPNHHGLVKQRKYLLIKKGQEWPIVDISEADKPRNGYNKQVIAIDDNDGKVYLFDSVSSIPDHLLDVGVGVAALSQGLRVGKNKGRECRYSHYLFMYKVDYIHDKLEKMTVLERIRLAGNKTNPRKPKRIKVTNTDTNEVTIYNSRQELAEDLGLTREIIMNRIYKAGKVWHNLNAEYID